MGFIKEPTKTTMTNQIISEGVRCSLPTFSEGIEAKLPDMLQKISAPFSTPDDKDAIILSAITTLSGTLSNVTTNYGGDDIYPSLFSCVVGSSGSNKGIIKFTRQLVQPIHQTWLESNGQLLLIPENCSSAGFLRILNANDGIGIITGTEIDTLLKTWKTGWGNFSADLRKAFHHEPITLYRKKDDEYLEINNPRLSLLTSGTPDQFAHLFAGNAENGLYSRFLVMYKPSSAEWKDQFQSSKQQTKALFSQLGKEYQAFHKILAQKKMIEVIFSQDQQDELNSYFENQYRNYGLTMGDESHAFVERAAIKLVKIAMVLTTLRCATSHAVNEKLEVSHDDFTSAMDIVRTLMQHFTALYEIIPQTEPVPLPEFKTEEMRCFFEALPSEFTSAQFEIIATNQGITRSSAYRHITHLVACSLINHISHGLYQKVG